MSVLEYSQTGSGKTHTKGKAHVPGAQDSERANIIPRAVQNKAEGVTSQTDNEYMVKTSIIEFYKKF